MKMSILAATSIYLQPFIDMFEDDKPIVKADPLENIDVDKEYQLI